MLPIATSPPQPVKYGWNTPSFFSSRCASHARHVGRRPRVAVETLRMRRVIVHPHQRLAGRGQRDRASSGSIAPGRAQSRVFRGTHAAVELAVGRDDPPARRHAVRFRFRIAHAVKGVNRPSRLSRGGQPVAGAFHERRVDVVRRLGRLVEQPLGVAVHVRGGVLMDAMQRTRDGSRTTAAASLRRNWSEQAVATPHSVDRTHA
jgi:hypothetical protein